MRVHHILGQLLKAYDIPADGIVHAGAHLAEEWGEYRDAGFQRMVWIEPNPALAEQIAHHGLYVLNLALGAVTGEGTLHITERSIQSSLLEPVKYTVKNTVPVQVVRLDELTANTEGCNVLILDVQGAELQALEGGGSLAQWDLIAVEAGTRRRYRGQYLSDAIDRYLDYRGFRMVREVPHGKSTTSDLVYIRKRRRRR
jgi:FkbM family methyltransferase